MTRNCPLHAEGRGRPKEGGHSGLVGGQFPKPGSLLTRLVLGGHRTRDLQSTCQGVSLCRGLARVSHIHHAGVVGAPSLSRSRGPQAASGDKERRGVHTPRTEEKARRPQLAGQPGHAFSITSSHHTFPLTIVSHMISHGGFKIPRESEFQFCECKE